MAVVRYGSCPLWQLSSMAVVRMAVVRMAVVRMAVVRMAVVRMAVVCMAIVLEPFVQYLCSCLESLEYEVKC